MDATNYKTGTTMYNVEITGVNGWETLFSGDFIRCCNRVRHVTWKWRIVPA